MESPPVASTKCRCGSNLKKKACVNCACSKLGYACKTDTCGCHGGLLCQNPFNKLDVVSIFGPDPVTLHECFIGWVLRQKKVRPEQLTSKFMVDIALQGAHYQIKEHFMEDSHFKPYTEWRAKWDALSKSDQEKRSDLHQEMNRLAFTKHDVLEIFFSFCRGLSYSPDDGQWEHNDHTWHCHVCGECKEWRRYPPLKCSKSESFNLAVTKWLERNLLTPNVIL